jgi:2-oxoglutarate dehydrogenase E1 component
MAKDPIALKFVSEMALDFRQEFGRDFVIDMYCYRKYGHQEVDDPGFTQPDLYAKIDKRPSITQIYKRELLDRGVLTQDDAASLETEFQLRLEMALEHIKSLEKQKTEEQAKFKESTAVFQSKYSTESKPTAISEEMLRTIVDGLTRVPAGFHILPKIKRMLIDRRRQTFKEGGPYDWGFAESLAFGSLLLENIPVRLSGQDSRRGTFRATPRLLVRCQDR